MLDYPSRRRLDACINISDLRDAAKRRAHKMVFDYLDAGADDEITIRRNKDAYSQLELHYKILAGLSPPLDMSTRVMGRDVQIPFFTSPTAGSKMFHADGEVGVARAAASHGAMYSLSTMGTAAPAEVAAALPTHHPKLFQLYVWKDRSLVRDMLAQARGERLPRPGAHRGPHLVRQPRTRFTKRVHGSAKLHPPADVRGAETAGVDVGFLVKARVRLRRGGPRRGGTDTAGAGGNTRGDPGERRGVSDGEFLFIFVVRAIRVTTSCFV